MAEWLKDSTLGKTGRPGGNRVDWGFLVEHSAFTFIDQPDKEIWLKLITLPNRNSAPYVRTRFPQWEFATRTNDDGGFDWYIRPKRGVQNA